VANGPLALAVLMNGNALVFHDGARQNQPRPEYSLLPWPLDSLPAYVCSTGSAYRCWRPPP
jgi:hypothetical protein